MILVTLGTQDKKFYRILNELEKLIADGIIKDEVIVQAGCSSDFKSKYMKIFDLIPLDEFETLIKKCDILITHGGVGSILNGIKNNKKVIAMPRLKKYKEHVNDHQLQIIQNFAEEGYIVPVNDINDLKQAILNISKFKPNKYKDDSEKLIEFVEKEIEEKNNNNFIDNAFVFLFIIFIFVGLIMTIFGFKKVNIYENRTAYQIPEISIQTILNKDYQNNLELAFSDQIPLSVSMKKGYNFMNNLVDYNLSAILFKNECQNRYIKISDSMYIFGCDNNLVYHYSELEPIKETLDKRINNINNLMNNTNLDVYIYYIEKDTDIDFSNNKNMGVFNYLKQNIKTNNIYKYTINNFSEFQKLFYKTDHHWNNIGSYKAYEHLISILNDEIPVTYNSEICIDKNFTGSKANFSGANNIYKEEFCVYNYDLPNYNIYVNKHETNYGNEEDCLNHNYSYITYGLYYGGDNGEVIINNNESQNKENILVIGSSYDNAILKLLANHYNNVYAIDLRNYERDINERFNYSDYIERNNINKVLLIGDLNYFVSGEFNVEV